MRTKETQGKLWSTAPQHWSTHFEPYFLPLYQKTLEQLHLTPEDFLLDAGCGSGMFSHMAIRTGAQVIGIDAAHGLINIARERNPGHNFLEEDLEALPFSNEFFDCVTGFNSFQYAGDVKAAIGEARRVLKTGGKMAIAIWDKPASSDGTEVLKAIGSLLPPPPPGTPGPFALSEDGRMERILSALDLKLVHKTTVTCPFLYSTLGDAVKSYMGTGPAAAAMNYASKKLVEQTIAEALEPYHITEDIYYMQNSFLLFITQKIQSSLTNLLP